MTGKFIKFVRMHRSIRVAVICCSLIFVQACASLAGEIRSSKAHILVETAASTSCTSPLILRHVRTIVDVSDSKFSVDHIRKASIRSKLLLVGLSSENHKPINNMCGDGRLTAYAVPQESRELFESFYVDRGRNIPEEFLVAESEFLIVRHMTSDEIRKDLNVKCKKEFSTRIDEGQYIQEISGEECRYVS